MTDKWIDTGDRVAIDFETFGAVNLPRFGLHRYVNNKTFTPLLAAARDMDDARLFDFTKDFEAARHSLGLKMRGRTIVAHNASFEQAVLKSMGFDFPADRFIDSAVLARAAGAAGKLEAAAPQLLGTDKLEVGLELIKLFSIPGKYQEENGSMFFDPRIIADHPVEWAKFGEYCEVDADLSYVLAREFPLTRQEQDNAAITMDMNMIGWHVDLELVEEMQRRYEGNLVSVEAEFRTATGAFELNLNSSQQLAEWCRQRGVRAKSFDEAHVERLLGRLERQVSNVALPASKADGYTEVIHMLRTKQALGGSSLKKLQVILDTTGEDGRLRDQYLHIGAGATYRTTGRGVQMQNLKRLNGGGDDMHELFVPDTEWTNGRLASNVRQVFTATHPQGQLVVGDFASVESRGLAWQAGERWKLDAYLMGHDLYKVQAGHIFGIAPEQVSKEQRQIGKVGELSCGYGAGGGAVKEFASKMGVELTETEAAKLVRDWRAANPNTVEYWTQLNIALHVGVTGRDMVRTPHGNVVTYPAPAPESLQRQLKDDSATSLVVEFQDPHGVVMFSRVLHGAHRVGNNILYWKPTERKTGDLWVDYFTNPKTKQKQKHHVYGGKLAGLLTQSLCREVFFNSLRSVRDWVQDLPNVELIGQFHDEVVLDWAPGPFTLEETVSYLHDSMTDTILPGFPLAAEIKSDYRYTK